MRSDSSERPDESDPDQDDVDCREPIIPKTKLDRRKGEVENEIQNKRQEDHETNLSLPVSDSDIRKTYGDDNIQHCPGRTEEPLGWRPGRLDETGIPLSFGAHMFCDDWIMKCLS